MIFWSKSNPQSVKIDPLLWKALTLADTEHASQVVLSWLQKNDDSRIRYEHHRLLAGLSRRLGKFDKLRPFKSMLNRIERQLWARAAASLSEFMPLTSHLHEMHLPFLLHGNLTWHAAGNPLLNDLETIDVLVPEEGLTFAATALWRAGWQPGLNVSSLFAPDPLLLSRSGFAHISIVTDAALMKTGIAAPDVWSNIQSATVLGHDVPVANRVSTRALLDLSRTKKIDDLQRAVNTFEAKRRGIT